MEKPVPGVMESLPVSQLLPSTGYCPALTPPLSDLDQGPFMAMLMLNHPTSTPSSLPTSPPSLHLLHCMHHYLASARTFSPFLLSTLSPNATYQALCPWSRDLIGPGLPCLWCPAWYCGSGSAWDTSRLSVVLLDLLIWIS